jgi:1-acyl-sn-glycerol-3-phosphate acyltransferase
MQAKMGIARLALATGVPVVPVAVWGSQYVLPRGMDNMKRSLSFGRPIMVKAGTPLDLADRAVAEDDRAALRRVTNAVMDELSRLVDDLRSRYPKRWVR